MRDGPARAFRTSKSIPDQQEHSRAKACLQKYCGGMPFWKKRRNERALAKTLRGMNAPAKTLRIKGTPP